MSKNKLFIDKSSDGSVSSLILDTSGQVIGHYLEDDVEGLIEQNKMERLDNPSGNWADGNGRKLGSITPSIAELWKNTLGVDIYNPEHMPKVKKLLSDPEWSSFRTCDAKYL